MPTVTMTIEEYEALMALVRSNDTTSLMTSPAEPAPSGKPKRRRKSKYSRELGRQLKMLKKKHPRTKVTALMKRAHRATRKALKR